MYVVADMSYNLRENMVTFLIAREKIVDTWETTPQILKFNYCFLLKLTYTTFVTN